MLTTGLIEALKPYPAYKDSGVEWLGEVPEHWEVRAMKRVARLNPSKSEIPEKQKTAQAVFLPMERVGTNGRYDASETRPIEEMWNGLTYFRRGDVIVAKITPCFENGKGACLNRLPTEFGFGSTEFHVIRPSREASAQYVYLLTTLREIRQLGAEMMTGAAGQQRVPADFFAGLRIPIPPLPEQTAIVRFLDWVDRRVRRVIRARRKRIKLLEEYKQALIHQAVTGQIDVRTGKPYPAYKDSGVEWLGKVPAHWEIRRLKTLCSMKSGEAITSDTIEPEGEYPVFGGNGIRGFTCRYTHEGNFVLIGRQGALCGNVHVARGRFWASEHAVVTRPHGDIVIEWLASLLTAMNLNQYSISAAQPGLAVERIINLLVPVPTVEEQLCIRDSLVTESEKIKAATATARRQIELLEEFRTRLIADVVTGKLDVREVAARLPEEEPDLDELEPEEDEPAGDEIEASEARAGCDFSEATQV
ncbi:restriction endonuclease subunit S [Deferrisoma sp.]